ncbi:unnamed protein product [Pylaiella littoralis]
MLPDGGATGGAEGLLVELELSSALALVREHGRPLLDVVRQTGEFLYRGEALASSGDGAKSYRPRAVIEAPDLLDEGTYGSPVAAEYFGAVDSALDKEFRAPARPSNAHIMVSDKEAAAAWGTACSVWPLGDSLDYSWLDGCSELWDPRWEKAEGRNSPSNGKREALFWRNDDSLRTFLSDGLRVNSGLPEAIRRGHEVLVRSGGFSLALEARRRRVVVYDAFVCIPASEDEAVRSALGIPPFERHIFR